MRSWNLGLCPLCKGDHLRLAGPVAVDRQQVEINFICGFCGEQSLLGLRTVRGRTEFAWLKVTGDVVTELDGSKAPIDFLVEKKGHAPTPPTNKCCHGSHGCAGIGEKHWCSR